MLAAGVLLGPYRILAPLGAGGMGEVYRARDTRLGRDVAVKVIRAEHARQPDLLRRFEQEARTAGALSHPHVCAVFDVGTHDGSPFVVMELLEGESLRARLGRGAVPARRALEWAAQAARGLAAAHDKGIVHRDLKPENLFLAADGRIKLLDFGLAKLMRPEPAAGGAGSLAETVAGVVVGSAGYMAPEQVRGEAVDARTDLFALGTILYELVSGRRAFAGEAFYEVSYRIVNEDPPPLAAAVGELPAGLAAVVGRCLEKRPEDRFRSAHDLAFALESLVGGTPDGTPAGDGAARAAVGPARRRRRAVAAAALALAVLAVAAAGFLLGTRRSAARATAGAAPVYTRLTAQRGRLLAARFAAGSGSIVYSAAWNGRPVELYEIRPGQSYARALGLARTNLLSVSRDGALAVTTGHDNFTGWTRPGTLASVPLQGGEPRSLLDDVLSGDWAPDGRTLAVAHGTAGGMRLEMPPGHEIYATAGRLQWLRVAPSGRWLAFVENPLPPDTRGRVVIIDPQGRVLARSDEWNVMLGLAWSPDGREAWFADSPDGAATDLRALAADGAQRVVTRFPGYMVLHDVAADGRALLAREVHLVGIRGRMFPDDEERELSWLDYSTAYDVSGDGRTLLFDEQGTGGGNFYAVCLRGMDGSAPVRLGEGHGCSLSPDGRTVAVVHFGEPRRLMLMPTGPGEVVTLPRGTVERYLAASWLPDGRRLAFVGTEAGRGWRTWIQDVAGGDPRAVTPEGVTGTMPSPDGTRLAVVDPDRRVLTLPLAGGEPQPVGALLPDESVLRWSADGRSLIVGRQGPHMEIARMALDSGRREPLLRVGPADSAGCCVWNTRITPDGRSYAYTWFRWLDELYVVEGLR